MNAGSASTGDDAELGRRTALRVALAGTIAAVAGAAAATGSASTADAAVGTMQYGVANNAGSDGTSLASSAAGRTLSVTNTASNGYAYGGEAETVYGGHGTVTGIDMTSGGTGARLRGVFSGVTALAENTASGDAIGILAVGTGGATGTGFGGFFDGSTYGGRFTGALAPLWLVPQALRHGVTRQTGEIVAEPAGTGRSHLWYAVAGGATPVLRKLAGPDTAGQLHVIDPVRVYDSRLDTGAGRAPMTSGSSRVVSVADGIDLATGAVTLAGVVPVGATAIAYNLTVVDTAGSGFLAVTAGTSTTFRASSINWSAGGQILANGQLAPLDADRRLRVFAGGGGSAHVLVDVQGYYR